MRKMKHNTRDAVLSIAAIIVACYGHWEVAAFLWILSEFQAVHAAIKKEGKND